MEEEKESGLTYPFAILKSFDSDQDLLLDFLSSIVISWLAVGEEDLEGIVNTWKDNVVVEVRQTANKELDSETYKKVTGVFQGRVDVFSNRLKRILVDTKKMLEITRKNREFFGKK